jgi:hypothetical protein
MAITTLASYQTHLSASYNRVHFQKNSITTVVGHTYSSWLAGGYPAAGAAPTTALVPTNATTGALTNSINASGGTQRILRAVVSWAIMVPGMLTVVDRLSHQGGLSGVTTGAQTTNLPTAALTRYTSGLGVEMGLEIYTTIGTTATTVSVSYTNSTPTSGRTSPLVTWGGTGFDIASRFVHLPLQVGDVGVTAVASVTATASTLTAGNFGVTLYFPVIAIPMNDQDPAGIDVDALFGFGTWFPQVFDNACLQFHYSVSTTSTGVVSGILYTATD